jgi:demethylmenaquinone methyltransferase/2-methoxy-6-polyprenyl-1,4-benzoquinol methylase
MSVDAKIKFFDGLADKWDGFEDLVVVADKLSRGLDELGITSDETVIDVGCGTGNLTQALLGKLSQRGRVVAIDISPEMIRKAREKVTDPRVEWHVNDVNRLPLEDGSVDRVICFSVWPHFDDPKKATAELKRILRAGGELHVWHLSSRSTVNEIHASANQAVANDVLVPAAETALFLKNQGLWPYKIVDNQEGYLVSARKPSDAS